MDGTLRFPLEKGTKSGFSKASLAHAQFWALAQYAAGCHGIFQEEEMLPRVKLKTLELQALPIACTWIVLLPVTRTSAPRIGTSWSSSDELGLSPLRVLKSGRSVHLINNETGVHALTNRLQSQDSQLLSSHNGPWNQNSAQNLKMQR